MLRVERGVPVLVSLLTLQGLHSYCKAAALGLSFLHGCLVPAPTQPHSFLDLHYINSIIKTLGITSEAAVVTAEGWSLRTQAFSSQTMRM